VATVNSSGAGRDGESRAAGDRHAIIESMKLEIPFLMPVAGVIADIFCAEGRVGGAGQILFTPQFLP
jgi:biotin carboxyl carrier protein